MHFSYIFYLLTVKNYYIFNKGNYVVTKCTTIWNSIVNLFSLLHTCSRLNHKDLSFAIGEDNFVIMSRQVINENKLNTIVELSSKLIIRGMVFKFCDLKDINSNNGSDFSFFYKYSVKNHHQVF